MKQAVLHIDGDSFFASCEVSLNHKLRGKPVVTGQERGIASAMSKEAKALGVSRGMPVYQIRKNLPQVIVVPSDYGAYELFAQRIFRIVGRHASIVEEYSIDECFALLDAWSEDAVKNIKKELQSELGMTFSLGLASTKVLAKLASSKNKPDGLTILPDKKVEKFLEDVDIGKVWGIGPSTARGLRSKGVKTALDLRSKSRAWGGEHLSKATLEIWHELNGTSLYEVSPGGGGESKSIQATRSFSPPTSDKEALLSEISKNIENACVKMRREKLAARKIYWFLKTQEFRYHRYEIEPETALENPSEIISAVHSTFDRVYKPRTVYRTTGVTLAGLVPRNKAQATLFGPTKKSLSMQELMKEVDKLDRRYGSHSVVLASSLEAFKRRNDTGFHKRLNIPYIGEVF